MRHYHVRINHYHPQPSLTVRFLSTTIEIISYWTSFPGTNDVVLRAQLLDWERFRAFQRKIRRYYQHLPRSDFQEKIWNVGEGIN